jgi:hypothetical protein
MVDSFPFWPANFIQNPFLITGRQVADAVEDIGLNKDGPSNGETKEINVIPIGAIIVPVSHVLTGTVYNPIKNTGAGPTLFDLFAATVNPKTPPASEAKK